MFLSDFSSPAYAVLGVRQKRDAVHGPFDLSCVHKLVAASQSRKTRCSVHLLMGSWKSTMLVDRFSSSNQHALSRLEIAQLRVFNIVGLSEPRTQRAQMHFKFARIITHQSNWNVSAETGAEVFPVCARGCVCVCVGNSSGALGHGP